MVENAFNNRGRDEIGFWDVVNPVYLKEFGVLVVFGILSIIPVVFIAPLLISSVLGLPLVDPPSGSLLGITLGGPLSVKMSAGITALGVFLVRLYRGYNVNGETWFRNITISIFYTVVCIGIWFPLLVFII